MRLRKQKIRNRYQTERGRIVSMAHRHYGKVGRRWTSAYHETVNYVIARQISERIKRIMVEWRLAFRHTRQDRNNEEPQRGHMFKKGELPLSAVARAVSRIPHRVKAIAG